MRRGESIRLTGKDRVIIMVLALFFFFGALLTGIGLTGLYLVDLQQESCSRSQDCPQGETCCYFYQESSGVCDQESNCKAIEQLTMEEKQRISTSPDLGGYKFTEEDKLMLTKQISSHLEKPMASNSFASIIAGLIMLILGVVWVIYLKRGN